MFADVDEWVKTCEDCQRRGAIEVCRSITSSVERVGVDVVNMSRSNEDSF